jgi:CubicO group peptidase (beta-lactamase class C family)
MDGLPRTTRIIEQGIADGRHFGAQVCVWRGERCVADGAVGRTGPDHGDASNQELTPDHRTLWLSAGKPILAIGLATQVEDGALTWDDPVAEWVPEFAERGKDQITLRQVLTHTGGFRSVAFRYPEQSWDDAIAAVCAGRLETGWEPGVTAGYHPHSGWNILGRVLEVCTDRPLTRFLRQRVLEPWGMHRSWVGWPQAEYERGRGELAGMYDTSGAAARDLGVSAPDWATGQRPGGNAWGPASELARFYRAVLAGGTLAGRRVVRAETLAEMTARQRRDTMDRTFRAVMDWGLGFMVNNRRHDAANAATHGDSGTPYGFGPHAGEDSVGHGGSQSSTGFADPQHGLAVAVIFNGQPGEPAHQRRMRDTLAALYEDLGLA